MREFFGCVLLLLFWMQTTVAQAVGLDEQAAVKAAVATAAESVVRLESVGGKERLGGMLIGTAPATGVVVDSTGYIVSSAFNFVQDPVSTLVTLPNGKRAAARVVATDHSRKIVLLKVDVEKPLVVPEAVPVEELRVGQWTVAVGRTFEGNSPNVSVGILSALNRIWGKAVQTDCKVSPVNYGGSLIDIRGRTIGVLVPLSPQGHSVVAGAEWYDSGIGFAIPLTDIFAVLDRLKSGEDLHRGLLGVGMKGKNELDDPPILASVPAGSPAALAGLKPNDRIIGCNGTDVSTQAQLKTVLGPLYAGDRVEVVALRTEDVIKVEVELAEKIEPYLLPTLGVLPQRNASADDAVRVRYVLEGSPADKAGFRINDELLALDQTELEGTDQWREALAVVEPGVEIEVRYRRGGEDRTAKLSLGPATETIPPELPTSDTLEEDSDEDQAEAENPPAPFSIREIKIPEESNQCSAFVPNDYSEDVAHGVVIWLPRPGKYDEDQLASRWAKLCGERDLILLAPRPMHRNRWQATELDFIRKTFDSLSNSYNVDPNRVVVHGYQSGGAMAMRFAFDHREVVRGVATVDAGIPMGTELRGNDPVDRLSIFVARPEGSKLAESLSDVVKRLRELKFPVSELTLEEGYLNQAELQSLGRWIDALDRL